MTAASSRGAALVLSLLFSVAQVHARTTVISNQVCFNSFDQRIPCPRRYKWWVIVACILGFIVVVGFIASLFLCRGRRGRSRAAPRRGFRWPWIKKYQPVSDPEGSIPMVAQPDPQYKPTNAPPYGEPEGQTSGLLAEPEKFAPRASEDSYYAPPQLDYEYNATPDTISKSYTPSSSSYHLPEPAQYQPPAYAPP